MYQICIFMVDVRSKRGTMKCYGTINKFNHHLKDINRNNEVNILLYSDVRSKHGKMK